MKALLVISSLIVNIYAQQNQLPAYMLGEFQLDTSKGFTAFMTQVGVNWFTRAVTQNLKIKKCYKFKYFL